MAVAYTFQAGNKQPIGVIRKCYFSFFFIRHLSDAQLPYSRDRQRRHHRRHHRHSTRPIGDPDYFLAANHNF